MTYLGFLGIGWLVLVLVLFVVVVLVLFVLAGPLLGVDGAFKSLATAGTTLRFSSSTSALMQFPRANKERLILAPSTIRIPRLLVCEARSGYLRNC